MTTLDEKIRNLTDDFNSGNLDSTIDSALSLFRDLARTSTTKKAIKADDCREFLVTFCEMAIEWAMARSFRLRHGGSILDV